MKRTIQNDNEIMKILNVKEISRIICNTDMGQLTLRLRKGETQYKFVLDAVELPKDLNKELMEALYPVRIEEVKVISNVPLFKTVVLDKIKIKNKGGRPRWSS